MDKDEIKRRINRRIDADDRFAENVKSALDVEDEAWLLSLIAEVIGFIIDVGSSIWEWVVDQFR